MLSMLGSLAAPAALSLIIVVSPPAPDSPSGGQPLEGPPGVPVVGTASAAGTPTTAQPSTAIPDLPDPASAAAQRVNGTALPAPTPAVNGPACSARVGDAAGLSRALAGAGAGSRVCVEGDLDSRLTIRRGGRPGQPLVVSGGGQAVVKGITVEADNVVVDGFQVLGAAAPGIELTGNGITASNNYVRHPTGGDFDGLRFFGDNMRILHNTITDISPDGSGAHADCMQTFTNGEPSSQNVIINGNLCDNIDNQCLMAEGPGDVGDGGGGDGTSANWLLSNNYCRYSASQAYMIEAVQNVTIHNNEFVGRGDKAIGLDIGSTGANVAANKLVGIKTAVGMSADSKPGYQGPQPEGGP